MSHGIGLLCLLIALLNRQGLSYNLLESDLVRRHFVREKRVLLALYLSTLFRDAFLFPPDVINQHFFIVRAVFLVVSLRFAD